jgi:hypothetical protein
VPHGVSPLPDFGVVVGAGRPPALWNAIDQHRKPIPFPAGTRRDI